MPPPAGAVQPPAVMFTTGSSQAVFTVAAGSVEGVFAAGASITAQTGTTAGLIRLDATTESGADTLTWNFPPAAVVIDTSTAVRNGSTLEVVLAGFDNTRTAGSLNFRF